MVALILMLATMVGLEGIAAYDPDLGQRLGREDGIVEWATVSAFLWAAGLWLVRGLQWRKVGSLPALLPLGMACFCVLVAGEELSWGQRLFGFRPTEYFLAHNEQQELNLHNTVSTPFRDLAFLVVAGGYGILLPLLHSARLGASRIGRRLRPIAPPLLLAPAFLVILLLFVFPRRSGTHEVVELALGQGVLFAALFAGRPDEGDPARRPLRSVTVAAMWVLTLGLGGACAWAGGRLQTSSPEEVERARIELEAIRRDFLRMARRGGGLPESYGFDQRLYTFVELNRVSSLLEGEFAGLTERGVPPARTRFFLDPWDMPYWIRDAYYDHRSRRELTLYSFGPNRRRDSTSHEFGGDDLIVTIPLGR